MHPNALLDSAAELVGLALKFDHPAHAVVTRYFRAHKNLGPRERATLTETVYAVLRRKTYFEALATSAPKGSGSKERRMAILAFHAPRDFLKSVLNPTERAWLDHCDALTESQVLEAERHNLPLWLAQDLQAQWGADFWPLANSLLQSAPLDLRVNTLKGKRSEVQKELEKAGHACTSTPYSPWGLRLKEKPNLQRLPLMENGTLEVQDEGSQLLACLVEPQRGEMVVDFCAGAGGKTLALGAMMRSTGRLYALDTSAHRLDELKPRLARSGLSNVHPVAITHERDDRIQRLRGKIDRVLVDAPCSGLGTLRRNPDLKWRQTAESVQALTQQQTAILESAARLLKSGGRLVYATCSVLQQENQAIAQAFTQAHPEFEVLPVADILTRLKLENPADLCAGPYLQLRPDQHQTDGFFAAVWVKS